MGRKTIAGLTKRGELWHINKVINGQRLCESTGCYSREEAERYLIRRLEQIRERSVFGDRHVHSWREAATRYLTEYQKMPSIELTATYLEQLDPFIGDLPVSHVDDEALGSFIHWMLKGGFFSDGRVKKPSSNRTVNIALQRVVRILNLCARSWRDADKQPWLESVPMIRMLDERQTKEAAYPLSWEEQRVFFSCLPAHLQVMALFKVNTGCREQEVCKLKWRWEIRVPELNTSVFLIPSAFGGRSERAGVKNREDRLVVLNDTAKAIVEAQRGKSAEWVFPFRDKALHRMHDTGWRNARDKAATLWHENFGEAPHPGFGRVRVHDLKHTFGRRLRAAGVAFEDRQVLLGHKSRSVTTDYSAVELDALIAKANLACARETSAPSLTVLRRSEG